MRSSLRVARQKSSMTWVVRVDSISRVVSFVEITSGGDSKAFFKQIPSVALLGSPSEGFGENDTLLGDFAGLCGRGGVISLYIS
jgi:hypothetical protein